MKHRKGIYMKTAPQQKLGEPPPDDDNEMQGKTHNITEVWLPESETAFKLLMAANLSSALFNNITDCDETYNYWEPLHHALFGNGFQTWEYSPVYAIRSWGYICIHRLFTWISLMFLTSNKLMIFYFVRMILGVICTVCELHFYDGVALRFGSNVARITLAFLCFGSGMFISSTAFLPSSFCMYMTFLMVGAWLQGQLHWAIMAVAASAIVGWPFAVALGIPLAVDVLVRRQKFLFFCKWCSAALTTMLFPVFLIDTYFYGKPVIASLNILVYNVFTEHGPDIYGTAPVSYYLKNGFLNFNIAFILALTAAFTVPVCEATIKLKYIGYRPPTLLLLFTFLPMYIWIGIFFSQPHKEERFLFPIYPLICLCAAVAFGTIQKLYCVFKFHNYIKLHWLTALTVLIYVLLSFSRSLALCQGYSGSMQIYTKLNKISQSVDASNMKLNVCVGKEWHRFPSSFFLPQNFTLLFVESEFRGQLPQPFSSFGTKGTRAVLTNFNDQNLEEKDRYSDLNSCHFLIDFNNGVETKREPIYSNDKDNWSVIEEIDFLDVQNSNSIFYRAFYIPFYFESRNSFGKYQLLQANTANLHRIVNL